MRKCLVAVAAIAVSLSSFGVNAFRVTPYLQHPAKDAMSILFFTEGAGQATVKWWPEAGGAEQSATTEGVLAETLDYGAGEKSKHASDGSLLSVPYRHRIRLTGLAEGTRYCYSVDLGDGVTYSNAFRTAPGADSSVRFIYYNDSETEPESTGKFEEWEDPKNEGVSRKYFIDSTTGYRTNLVHMAARKPDFYAIAGDLAQYGGEQRDWDEFWRHNAGSYNDPAGSAPILAAPGNHEYGDGDNNGNYAAGGNFGMSKYLTYFEFEPNGAAVDADQQQRFHRVDYGPVTLIFLDANNGDDSDIDKDMNLRLFSKVENATLYPRGDSPYPATEGTRAPDFNVGSPQFVWFTNQLADAQQKAKFTFVVCHPIPYSVGCHNRRNGVNTDNLSPDFRYYEDYSGQSVRFLEPYLHKYGVAGWLCGHDEIMEHSRTTGTETLPDGTTREHVLNIFDMATAGDGLRGKVATATPDNPTGNPYEVFRAHKDAPEVWQDGVLVDGGKHYAHMEVNVEEAEPGVWTCKMEPVYSFVSKAQDGTLTFDRRVYDDVVVLTNDLRGSGGTQAGSVSGGDAHFYHNGRHVIKYTNTTQIVVSEPVTAEVLLIAGGGGGGSGRGGGGGGGGVIHRQAVELTAGTYDLVIGAGGAGGAAGGGVGANGGNTSAFDLTAFGGGGGGQIRQKGLDGGCGGGGAGFNDSESTKGGAATHEADGNLGYSGGGGGFCNGGGGGGAGEAGAPAAEGRIAGKGGDGYWCEIAGRRECFAGGGGGGAQDYTTAGAGGVGGGGFGSVGNRLPTNGVDGFGGGGGGGGTAGNTHAAGGAGGSGCIIIAFEEDEPGAAEFSGGESILLLDGSVSRFASDGELTVTKAGLVEVLLVGGGGGGGTGMGGGGGAGGVVSVTNLFLLEGTYPISVGPGGEPNSAGGATVAFGLTAFGGGKGGVIRSGGGSGANGGGAGGYGGETRFGGAALYNTINIGCSAESGTTDGAELGSGGGGAGGPGGSAVLGVHAGDGGIGYRSSITGKPVYYAGGGGGGVRYWTWKVGQGGTGGGGAGGNGGADGDAQNGVDGLGGGGGGGGMAGQQQNVGGRGGSGVVIVRTAQVNYQKAFEDATGGEIKKTRTGYFVHSFLEDGTFTVPHNALVDVFLVGGGGGGGVLEGGGGGAGGVLAVSNLVIAAGSYEVTVGKGGAGATGTGDDGVASNGTSSIAFGLEALGGGRGGHFRRDGGEGASGGGGSGFGGSEFHGGGLATVLPDGSTQGFGGGDSLLLTQQSNTGGGGGGGGAGGPGGATQITLIDNLDGTVTTNLYAGGVGGIGIQSDFSGELKYYAGGGGGGNRYNGRKADGGQGGGGTGGCTGTTESAAGQNGTDGLGGGGGGSGGSGWNVLVGGRGGNGIVMIRYRRPQKGAVMILR